MGFLGSFLKKDCLLLATLNSNRQNLNYRLTMKKLILIITKTVIALLLLILIIDLIGSYIRYRNYYKQKTIEHPLLESVHADYSVIYGDKSSHKMTEFSSKVKLLYWHSGCPGSTWWLPELKKIADEHPDSLVVFVITEQSVSNLDLFFNTKNLHICKGAGRINENRFKHVSSSHLVILDKDNRLNAYGYQLAESDSVIKHLENNSNMSSSLIQRLKEVENEFQRDLKSHDNYSFSVAGFDNNRTHVSSECSINWVDFVNSSIGWIYQTTMRIPDYRMIDLTNRNIRSDSTSNQYCVYYKTKVPFAPFTYQMLFDNKEKRHQVFVADIQKRLDKEFGLISEIKIKTTPTLVLKRVTPNEKNQFEKLSRKEKFLYDVNPDRDTSRWNYNLQTHIWSITNAIENVLKMPVQTEYESTDKYHIVLSFLNSKKFNKKEIIEDLRKQGLSLDIESREVEYLEIKNAADNSR